jgi:hypothetical protein
VWVAHEGLPDRVRVLENLLSIFVLQSVVNLCVFTHRHRTPGATHGFNRNEPPIRYRDPAAIGDCKQLRSVPGEAQVDALVDLSRDLPMTIRGTSITSSRNIHYLLAL